MLRFGCCYPINTRHKCLVLRYHIADKNQGFLCHSREDGNPESRLGDRFPFLSRFAVMAFLIKTETRMSTLCEIPFGWRKKRVIIITPASIGASNGKRRQSSAEN
jgi:hypothetical protein